MRRAAWLGAAATLMVAAALLFLARGGHDVRSDGVGAPRPSKADGQTRGTAAPDWGSAAARIDGQPVSNARTALPASLQGTEIDGGLLVDASGRFVPTRDAIDLFDYFLAASGEEPLEVLRARIVAQIHALLDGPAAKEAEALLDTYLDFRASLRALAESGEAPHGLERRLQWIRELRRAHFGADTADTLFGEEERMLAVDLERHRVQLDDDLDDDTRRERLAALEAELPPQVREARQAARAPARSYEHTEGMRAAGSSEAEIFAARESQFGREAAERLAAVDADRAVWQRRLGDYMAARDALLVEAAESPGEERAAAVDALRSEHFDGLERRRVQALEGALPTSQ